ncbi:MAG TPA: peptide deformylase [Bacillota bacterium]|nr:peptide deformylase [Bacillota bacterium]
MAIRDIVQLGDPRLRMVSRPIDSGEFGGAELNGLLADLLDTLHEFQRLHGTGRGIAAPQIGVARRAVRVDSPDFSYVLINPEITWASDEMFEVWDSCFSYWGVVFLVTRHREIKVTYFDESGEKHLLHARDDLAELLQHELEHLDGSPAIDQLVSPGKIMTQAAFTSAQGR